MYKIMLHGFGYSRSLCSVLLCVSDPEDGSSANWHLYVRHSNGPGERGPRARWTEPVDSGWLHSNWNPLTCCVHPCISPRCVKEEKTGWSQRWSYADLTTMKEGQVWTLLKSVWSMLNYWKHSRERVVCLWDWIIIGCTVGNVNKRDFFVVSCSWNVHIIINAGCWWYALLYAN